MPVDPTPVLRDPARLAALHRLCLLDRPVLPAFDRLTRMAARLLRVPTAFVTLVDADRQFFAACQGFAEPTASARQTPLSHSFCQYVVALGMPLVVEDARAHPLLCDNLAIPDLGVVAYAGIPLRTSDGHLLGTLCVAESVPRDWQPNEVELLTDLAATVLTEIELRREIAEREVAEQAVLRAAETRFYAVMQAANDAIVLADSQGGIIGWNRGAETIFGYTEEEMLGRPLTCVLHDRRTEASLRGLMRGHGAQELARPSAAFETEGLRRDGSEFPIELSLATWGSGQNTVYSAIIRDSTERKRLEAQFLQAQKMESVGRLAGGVAHDFNNLLTAIRGYVELAMQSLPQSAPVQADLHEIQNAAERAAGLTRQLLTFARKQMIKPQPLDLNQLIVNLERMLRRLIGADVELSLRLAPDLGKVKADVGQIEQVIVNLVVNARDAMPHGGKLLIETAAVTLGPQPAGDSVAPGRYVALAIRDSGTGIAPEARAHLFEPFFTTKSPDKGSGLGLATCYGIVKQHGGLITYTSELGLGTTFTIHLPCVELAAAGPQLADSPNRVAGGHEAILLVEDDAIVRRFAARVLRTYGYHVLEASDGIEAIELFEGGALGEVALLLSDLVMPRLSGHELAHRLTEHLSRLRVLFTTGYNDPERLQLCQLVNHAGCLHKPYTPMALLKAVRTAIDGGELVAGGRQSAMLGTAQRSDVEPVGG